MTQKIIGIAGKRGTGKTTAADYLVKNHRFKKISFAGSLKDKAKLFFPFSDYDFNCENKEKRYKYHDWTVREFLIRLGNFMRFHDPNYWVKESGLANAYGRIVIDDVRFPNEVEYIQELGGKLVRLNRYPHLNIYGEKELDDPSETSLDAYKKWDYEVESCWNVKKDDLYKQMDFFVKGLEL